MEVSSSSVRSAQLTIQLLSGLVFCPLAVATLLGFRSHRHPLGAWPTCTLQLISSVLNYYRLSTEILNLCRDREVRQKAV